MDAADPQVTCVTGNCAYRTCGLLLLCVTIVRVIPERKDVIRACSRVEIGPTHTVDLPYIVDTARPPAPSNSV